MPGTRPTRILLSPTWLLAHRLDDIKTAKPDATRLTIPLHPVPAKVNPEVFDAYEGDYFDQGVRQVTVIRTGDRLEVKNRTGDLSDILPETPTVFFYPNGGKHPPHLREERRRQSHQHPLPRRPPRRTLGAHQLGTRRPGHTRSAPMLPLVAPVFTGFVILIRATTAGAPGLASETWVRKSHRNGCPILAKPGWECTTPTQPQTRVPHLQRQALFAWR